MTRPSPEVPSWRPWAAMQAQRQNPRPRVSTMDDSDVLGYSYITDTYVETIESMGIDQVIEAYQSAGERYFGRID